MSIDEMIDRIRSRRHRPRVHRPRGHSAAEYLAQRIDPSGQDVYEPMEVPAADPRDAEVVPSGTVVARRGPSGKSIAYALAILIGAALVFATLSVLSALHKADRPVPANVSSPVVTVTVAPSPPATAAVTAPPSPAATAQHEAEPSVPDASPTGTAQQAAYFVAQTWLATDVGREAWIAHLLPICTPQLGHALSQTDLANVPHAQPSDGGRGSSDAYTGRYTFRLSDGTSVSISMTSIGGHWVAASIEPADS